MNIYPDGEVSDWEKLRIQPIYEDPLAEKSLRKMYVTSDEENICLRLDYEQPIDLEHINTQLLLDTIDNQGQSSISLPNGQMLQTDFGVDFLVNLSNKNDSRILVDSYYDSFYFHYGHLLKMIPQAEYALRKDNGLFHPIRLALNKELTIPSTGEKLPFLSYETGRLNFGNGNPLHKDFNSLTDISISKDRKTLELSLPWALLNMKDPSQKEAIGNLWEKGLTGSETIKGIRIAIAVSEPNEKTTSFPNPVGGKLTVDDSQVYSWEDWEQPAYHEKLKESYWIMKEAFSKY